VWQLAGALLLLLFLTWLALISRRRYLVVGWLWFLGTMVPMSGLIQAGNQAMADRHGYVPYIGLFFAVCWGVADGLERWQSSKVLIPVGTVAVLLLLMFATRRQVGYWSDDLTLWTHTAEAVPNNALAENMIGEIVLRRGDPEAAIAHFRAAAALDPLFPFAQLHIGIYEEEHHHPRQAIERLQNVIDLTQRVADRTQVLRMAAFAHLSYAYNELGDYANQQKYVNLAAQVAER
jgi:tetratricopeptide (TPR) repeat protein